MVPEKFAGSAAHHEGDAALGPFVLQLQRAVRGDHIHQSVADAQNLVEIVFQAVNPGMANLQVLAQGRRHLAGDLHVEICLRCLEWPLRRADRNNEAG